MKPATMEAYKLLHDGSIALARVEANGMRIDMRHLENTARRATFRAKFLTELLEKDPIYGKWRARFGRSASLTKRQQFAYVLFDILKYECRARTAPTAAYPLGQPKTDKKSLAHIDSEFVQDYFRLMKYLRIKSTFLEGIKREVVNGFLHPIQNLNIARTYRGSSDHPNGQNFPVRDPEMGKMIRQCIIPRNKNYVGVEFDFKGIEVAVAACYCKDPNLISYVSDPSKDMHRDMAAQCYMLPPDKVSKYLRYCAKNQFVFPQFYGDFYPHCARALWESLDREPEVKGYLASKGIRKLGKCDPQIDPVKGTFEYHIKEVEADFWGRRFEKYAQWKKRQWEQYQEEGGFNFFTGFAETGIFSRNDVTNHRIQGSAFHILLWTLIQTDKWLRQRRMRSKIINQIHDSMMMDVHRSEYQEVLAKVIRIATIEVREHWPWIIVPLTIEVEKYKTNWHNKRPVKLEAVA